MVATLEDSVGLQHTVSIEPSPIVECLREDDARGSARASR